VGDACGLTAVAGGIVKVNVFAGAGPTVKYVDNSSAVPVKTAFGVGALSYKVTSISVRGGRNRFEPSVSIKS
jgi:hypothetical protein